MEYEIRMRGDGSRSNSTSSSSSSNSSSSGEGSACSLMSAGNWLETLYGQHMAAAAAYQFPGSAALLLGQLRSAASTIGSGGGAPEPMAWKSEPPDEDVDDAEETATTRPDKEQLTTTTTTTTMIKQEPSEVNVKLENDEDDGANDETPIDSATAAVAADRTEDDNPDDEASVESWKDKGVPNVLSSWFLNAYTTMLGRLSFVAAAASFDDALLNSRSNLTSDSRSGSESGHSSYLDALHRSRESSPSNSSSAKRKTNAKSGKVASRRRKKAAVDVDGKLRSLDGKSPAASLSEGKKRTLALQRVRYEREEYRCYLCPYACTIEKAFQRHLRAHARGTADAGQMPRLSCAVCGADRSSELDLSKHMRRHRDNRYFCCDICIFRTVQLKKLIQHRRMHTGEKPHLCPHCAYRSARRDNLRSHVRRVHKKENLFCDTFSPRGMFNISKLASLADESNDENDDDERDADDNPNNDGNELDVAGGRDNYVDDNNSDGNNDHETNERIDGDNEISERIAGVNPDTTMQLQEDPPETSTVT
ncbi:hypothetical protein TKK_0001427 [Trichogramma kaykai]|uniref:C2H2-type domain-containing protein n=1 Tax=Trichogramma kaykai TaxID=54128 RepID=A0ABD2X1P3_9HYME